MTGTAANEALTELARSAIERGLTSEEKSLQAQVLWAAGMELSAAHMWAIAAIMARLEEENYKGRNNMFYLYLLDRLGSVSNMNTPTLELFRRSQRPSITAWKRFCSL